MLNIDQLKYFMAVARCKNFSAAAEECFISQSSLSKNIRALEESLDTQLFLRTSKKVEITEAGKEFFKYAERMLQDYEEMNHAMIKYAGDSFISIKVGTIPVINHYGLTDLFYTFQVYYPNIHLHLIEDNSIPIVEYFEKHLIDIAFLRDNYLPVDPDGYDKYVLVEDDLVLVVNKSNPLAQKDVISLLEAKNEQFLFLSKRTGMYQTCHEQCLKAGFIPKEKIYDVRSATLKNLVAQGQGVSLMMYQSVKHMDFEERVSIVHLKDANQVGLTLVIRKNLNNAAIDTFSEFVRDSYGKLSTKD